MREEFPSGQSSSDRATGNMNQLLLLLLSPLLCLSAPQLGFGDATEAEIAEIRSGNYLEDFEENPSYNYNYRIADDRQQTYIAMEEERQDGLVTGSYSYVDPTGALVVVNYQAGPQGYSETREVSHNFVTIRAKPVRTVADDQQNVLAVQEVQRVQEQRRQQQRNQEQRLQEQRLQEQRLQEQRLQEQRLQEQRLQEQRLQEQRLQEQRVEEETVGEQNVEETTAEKVDTVSTAEAEESDSDLVEEILAQLEPLVSNTVTSTVQGQGQGVVSQAVTSDVSRFSTSGGRPIPRLSVPRPSLSRTPLRVVSVPAITFRNSPSPQLLPLDSPPLASSVGSDVSGVFGSGDVNNVKFHTPDFQIEY